MWINNNRAKKYFTINYKENLDKGNCVKSIENIKLPTLDLNCLASTIFLKYSLVYAN